MKNKNQGFALLIAVIFMSVMLALGIALSSLGYKQQVLASSAIESQHAFYAADAAMECALLADQKLLSDDRSQSFFVNPTMSLECAGQTFSIATTTSSDLRVSTIRYITLSENRCADVKVYKPLNGIGVTYIFSTGYDASCAAVSGGNVRFVSRGIKSQY